MKEHTFSTLHCDGLESRKQSELLQLSTLLCSRSLSCSFSFSTCRRSLVVIGPGGSSSSLSIHMELETLWLSGCDSCSYLRKQFVTESHAWFDGQSLDVLTDLPEVVFPRHAVYTAGWSPAPSHGSVGPAANFICPQQVETLFTAHVESVRDVRKIQRDVCVC